jgi:NADH-quinone oxidoreductase subunit M
MFQKTFYGEITNPLLKRLKDLKRWEIGLVGVFVVFIFWGGLYPNTFLQPMERSLEAARLMSISGPGQGPSWSDKSHEINDKGDLVVVGTRTESGGWDKEHPGQPIMLANHFVKPEPTEYTAPQPPEAAHGGGHEEDADVEHAEEEEAH